MASLWLRLYTEMLHDPKVQRLPDKAFRLYINLLLIAKEENRGGALPPMEDVAFLARIVQRECNRCATILQSCGLLDATEEGFSIHGFATRQFQSDSDPTAAERKARQRRKNVTGESRVTSRTSHANVTRTETETETETENTNTVGAAPPPAGPEEPPPLPVPVKKPRNPAREPELQAVVDALHESFDPLWRDAETGKTLYAKPAAQNTAIVKLAEMIRNLSPKRPVDAARLLVKVFQAEAAKPSSRIAKKAVLPTTLITDWIFNEVVMAAKAGAGKDPEAREAELRRIVNAKPLVVYH